MRAISAPTSAARFLKFSGQFSRPDLELSLVSGQSLQMLLALVGVTRSRSMQREAERRKGDTRRLQGQCRCESSTAAVAHVRRTRWRQHSRRQRSAPAACGSSRSIGTQRLGLLANRRSAAALLKLLIVKASECPVRPAQSAHQTELRREASIASPNRALQGKLEITLGLRVPRRRAGRPPQACSRRDWVR